MKGLDRNDSRLIGFVISAVFKKAALKEDLRRWSLELIKKHDDLPTYIFDLCDFNGYLIDIFGIIGFVPHWEFSNDEQDALYGIAYKRGVSAQDCPITEDQALEKLQQYQHIEKKFRELFPFIYF